MLILLVSIHLPNMDLCEVLMREQRSILRQYEKKVKEQNTTQFLSIRIIIARELISLRSNFYALERQLEEQGCQHLPNE